MGFALSLSGLTSEARALDVVGNNIANSQTVGFKSTKARFADVYGSVRSAGADSSDAVAAGVSSLKLHQQFRQGAVDRTGRPLDVAINGNGFFRLLEGNEVTYTRNGEFQLKYEVDGAGQVTDNVHLVSRDGRAVTGYRVSYASDPQGTVVQSNPPVPIIMNTVMPPQATSGVQIGANFDSRSPVPTVTPFDSSNPLSFNSNTGVTVYGDADETWPPGRKIWNQHAYYITNVGDHGDIPSPTANNYSLYNSFRSGDVGRPPSEYWDLTTEILDVCEDECDDGKVYVAARVANNGNIEAPAGLPVSLRAGAGGPILDSVLTTAAIPSGKTGELLRFEVDAGSIGGTVPIVTADEDLTGGSAIFECDEGNNAGAWSDTVCN